MASIDDIADALLARCGSLNVGSPALPKAYPEASFTPPADGKYLRIDFYPNRPAWEGLSDGKLSQGLLQITVVWPKGQGIVRPMDAAQAVMGHFAKGTILSSGSARVKINGEPWAASPLSEAGQVSVPVTIPWVA